MYLDYFGLKKEPFTISPDPSFLYPSVRHRQALAHLKYGLEREGGFILLTGEVGTGKTTLTRLLLRELPGNVRVAYILNARLGELDLMSSICQELRIPLDADKANIREYTDALNKDLLDSHANGTKTLLVIEEAQNLDPTVLEMLRLLTNLETDTTKLLHILLVAQPELLEVIGRPELRQLNQRVVSRYHLEPLDLQETTSYLSHRLSRAGCNRPVFDQAASAELHRISKGVPRVINLLSERSLLGAYASEEASVTKHIVQQASKEVFSGEIQLDTQNDGKKGSSRTFGRAAMLASILALLVFGGYVGARYFPQENLAASVNVPPELPKRLPLHLPVDLYVEANDADVIDVQAESQNPVADQILPNAYDALLKLWSIDETVTRQADLCSVGTNAGLVCQVELSLDVEELAQKRRPGIVRLVDADDQASMYFLASLSDEGFNLSNSKGTFRLTSEELASRWDGIYLYFWQPPQGYVDAIYVGTKNAPVVDWLQDQMVKWNADYQQVITGGVYSVAISEQVRFFQADNGMESDGVLGKDTIMALYDLSNQSPKLERTP